MLCMATLVSVETKTGTLTRYEVGGSAVRITHRCSMNRAASIPPEVVASFRTNPPDDFSLEPPPRPTSPPAGAGTVRAAA